MILEGKVKIFDQEGGYAAPYVEIGNKAVEDVFQSIADEQGKKVTLYEDIELDGVWRVTVERIDK